MLDDFDSFITNQNLSPETKTRVRPIYEHLGKSLYDLLFLVLYDKVKVIKTGGEDLSDSTRVLRARQFVRKLAIELGFFNPQTTGATDVRVMKELLGITLTDDVVRSIITPVVE